MFRNRPNAPAAGARTPGPSLTATTRYLEAVNQARTVQTFMTLQQIHLQVLQRNAAQITARKQYQFALLNDRLQELQEEKEEKEPQCKPATPAQLTDEERAAIKLKLARRLAEEGLKQQAKESYQEIVERYPQTLAANEARQLLGLPAWRSPGEQLSAEGPSSAVLLEELKRLTQVPTATPKPLVQVKLPQ
jgi:hypothetical protein